jgi:hypothetical protein
MKPRHVKKILDFTERELEHIFVVQRWPVILDIHEHLVRVGGFSIFKSGNLWTLVMDSVQTKNFSKKIYAVAFAVLWEKNLVSEALALELNDSLRGRLDADIHMLQQRMRQTLESKKYERFELYRNKYQAAMTKRCRVSAEIKKTLINAKYIKIGCHHEFTRFRAIVP